jgi:hypothetical protein
MKISLWTILKECVGKDLAKISMPVYFNEPVSMIQKIAEAMATSDLIDKAV